MRAFIAIAIALIMAFGTTPASAHVRSESFSRTVVKRKSASVQIRMSAIDLVRFGSLAGVDQPDPRQLWIHGVAQKILLTSSAGSCKIAKPVIADSNNEGDQLASLFYECPGPLRKISFAPLLSTVPSHIHFATVRQSGHRSIDTALTTRQPELDIESSLTKAPSRGLGQYFIIGIGHILSGWDHLLFLLGLCLVARMQWRRIFWLVTGFTIGHSLSLSLAVFNFINVRIGTVEVLIGLSIMLLGIEAGLRGVRKRGLFLAFFLLFGMVIAASGHGTDHSLSGFSMVAIAILVIGFVLSVAAPTKSLLLQVTIVTLFGVMHGMAFAGGLIDADVQGLALVLRVAAFNIGVEIGQIAFLATFFGLVYGVARVIPWKAQVRRIIFAAAPGLLTGIGMFLLVSRGLQ